MSLGAQGLRVRLMTKVGLVVVGVTLVGFAAFGVAHALSAATQTAPAVVTQPDALTALNSGGSATSFTIVIPPNSHCSGDTHSNGFLIYSYITAADPSTLTFTPDGPSSGFPLYDLLGSADINRATAIASGNIGQAPTFNYAFYNTDGVGGNFVLPPGTYNVGIACATNTGALDQFWNVQETFTANASDPNGEVWAVAGVTATTTTSTTVVGATTTTSTTVVGATTTTSTTVVGATTTTSTSVVGGTTTTSTTVPGSTTTSTTGDVTGSGSSNLATTGGSPLNLYDWGVGFVCLGLAILLFSDRRRREDRGL